MQTVCADLQQRDRPHATREGPGREGPGQASWLITCLSPALAIPQSGVELSARFLPSFATVVMANKGLDRKAAAVGVEGKRMLILDQEKCKPMMPAHDFLKRIARSCGRDCITMTDGKKIQILEDACLACLNRAKQCPGDAVKIIKLPSNLQTDVTHKCGAALKLRYPYAYAHPHS